MAIEIRRTAGSRAHVFYPVPPDHPQFAGQWEVETHPLQAQRELLRQEALEQLQEGCTFTPTLAPKTMQHIENSLNGSSLSSSLSAAAAEAGGGGGAAHRHSRAAGAASLKTAERREHEELDRKAEHDKLGKKSRAREARQ